MHKDTITIGLPLPFRMGSVICCLTDSDVGYGLIDTGGSNGRKAIMSELENAGCKPVSSNSLY